MSKPVKIPRELIIYFGDPKYKEIIEFFLKITNKLDEYESRIYDLENP